MWSSSSPCTGLSDVKASVARKFHLNLWTGLVTSSICLVRDYLPVIQLFILWLCSVGHLRLQTDIILIPPFQRSFLSTWWFHGLAVHCWSGKPCACSQSPVTYSYHLPRPSSVIACVAVRDFIEIRDFFLKAEENRRRGWWWTFEDYWLMILTKTVANSQRNNRPPVLDQRRGTAAFFCQCSPESALYEPFGHCI